MKSPLLYPKLRDTIAELQEQSDALSSSRTSIIRDIADYIVDSKKSHRKVNLLFVCTHNSRRSIIAQIWAHFLAAYFKTSEINSYSGGTEATAFHPNAIASLQRFGFSVEELSTKTNPRQIVRGGEGVEELYCYSKRYNEPPNPEQNFAAVMVCSDADSNCPFIPGVERRISLTYEDPKNYDGTPQQDEMYDRTVKLIGAELYWCFNRVQERLEL